MGKGLSSCKRLTLEIGDGGSKRAKDEKKWSIKKTYLSDCDSKAWIYMPDQVEA